MYNFIEAHFRGINRLIVASLIALAVFWSECLGGKEVVINFLSEHHRVLFSALASIYGSLLGFTIATVAILLGFSNSDRLKIVRESPHYTTIWEIFKDAIRWLGLATLSAVILIVPDGDSTFVYVGSIVSFAVFWHVVLLLGRCIWVLENIITLVTSRPPK